MCGGSGKVAEKDRADSNGVEGWLTRSHLFPAAAARRAAHPEGKLLGQQVVAVDMAVRRNCRFRRRRRGSPRRLTQATTDCNALALVFVLYRAAPRARACAVAAAAAELVDTTSRITSSNARKGTSERRAAAAQGGGCARRASAASAAGRRATAAARSWQGGDAGRAEQLRTVRWARWSLAPASFGRN